MSATPLWGIPPGADFAAAFVAGLPDWLGDDNPETLARTTIYVNTRRAMRRLSECFAAQGNCLLPRMRLVTDLSRDILPGLPPGTSESPMARELRALQLVRALIARRPDLAAPASAFDLARSLGSLFADIEASGQDLTCLEKVTPLDLAAHWAASREFLSAVAPLWPETLNEMPMGSDIRHHAATAALARLWDADPPPDPVLVVGSTGSRATTQELMALVAGLPRGAIVLPGVDTGLNARAVAALTPSPDHDGSPDHPQSILVALANRLGVPWSEIGRWPLAQTPHPARAALTSLALRPAPITDEWRKDGPRLVPEPQAALDGLSLVEAPSDRVEATAIAIALRDALEAGKTAALITPEATLSRRVAANLARWGITPDESAGQPLTLAPAGTLVQFLLDAAADPVPTTALVALLKHPLCAGGENRTAYLNAFQNLERQFLRHCGPAITLARLAEEAPPIWKDWLAEALLPLATFSDLAPLSDRATALVNATELIARGPDTAPEMDQAFWTEGADPKVLAALDDLAEAGAETSTSVTTGEFRAILHAALSAEQDRDDAFLADPRISLWGTLEARTQSADVLVLGGLNEGSWPKLPNPDPWLSRPMRRAAGLPVPDEVIGLSAHDFQLAICHREVVLSRSARQGDAPSVPSRWLTRLANLLGGLSGGRDAWDAALERGSRIALQAGALERAESSPEPEPRPAPAPPAAARPTRISASRVETLVRDPYAIYAADVLKLRPLPEPGRLPDARDRGTILHAAIEAFTKAHPKALPEDAEDEFTRIVTAKIASAVHWPAEAKLWSARLARGARDFIRTEAARRQIGVPALLEAKAEHVITSLEPPVTFVAKADRIDTSQDGTIAIYDYKSTASSIPTEKQLYRYAPQIPLEAELAMLGAFADLPVPARLHLEFIALFSPETRHIRDLSEQDVHGIWAKFVTLLRTYQNAQIGYAAQYRPHPNQQIKGDYDHLARRGEWDDACEPTLIPVGL